MSTPYERLIQQVTAQFPGIWAYVDDEREDLREIEAWPDNVFLPITAWAAIFVSYISETKGVTPQEVVKHLQANKADQIQIAGTIARAATWRLGKDVYRFDKTLYESLIETELNGNIPNEIFNHLPNWCIYVETPGQKNSSGQPIEGFFARLDYSTEKKETALRIDVAGPTTSMSFPYIMSTRSIIESAKRSFHDTLDANLPAIAPHDDIELQQKILSLLLYICTANADITKNGIALEQKYAAPTKTKKGLRYFAPNNIATWDVGTRIGALIRHHKATAADKNEPTGKPAKPHIRRAHWHGFWSGPMTGERKFDLKWLPPIPVNIESYDNLPNVIHPVR